MKNYAFWQKLIKLLSKFESQIPYQAGSFYIILYSLFFTVGSMFTKLLTRVPIYQTTQYSSLVSLVLCVLTENSNKIPKKTEDYHLLLRRGILGAFGLIFYMYSVKFLPLSIVVVIILMKPLWLIILGRLFYNENFGLPHFFMVISCFLGLFLIIQPAFLFNNIEIEIYDRKSFILGIFFGIISSLSGAVVLLTITSLKEKVSVVLVLFYYNFFGVLVGTIGSQYEDIVALNLTEFCEIFIVGTCFYLSQISKNRALFLEKPLFVGIVSYIQLIISFLFDSLISGIYLNESIKIGCLIVLMSILCMVYYDYRKKREKNRMMGIEELKIKVKRLYAI